MLLLLLNKSWKSNCGKLNKKIPPRRPSQSDPSTALQICSVGPYAAEMHDRNESNYGGDDDDGDEIIALNREQAKSSGRRVR